ncbi:MAG: hypothetical protein M1838_000381 [Thelocarpon superellum]|nr:MAG: hypothetical protein M1838_000381 [Thelocarpon superellum]
MSSNTPKSSAEEEDATTQASNGTSPVRFSAEEEATLLEATNEQKRHANTLFGSSQFQDAITGYDKALATCPNYLDFEVAVLRSNVAACHLKLAQWKEAVTAATASLDALNRLQGIDIKKKGEEAGSGTADDEKGDDGGGAEEREDEEEADEEVVSAGARKGAVEGPKTYQGHSDDEIGRMRTKTLLRRAKARAESGAWADLQAAQEDYQAVSSSPALTTLSAQDRAVVQRALRSLPSRMEQAKGKEVAEMMSKLKELGNGILKPFGLSTDNFNLKKDEGSGGYSMEFNQGGGK